MWFLIFIPVITLTFLYKYHRNQMAIWEWAVPIIATLIAMFFTQKFQDYVLSDTEYHANYIEKAVWKEHWTEIHHNKKSTSYTYHPDQYFAEDSGKNKIDIDYNHYKELVDKFGNESKDKPFRMSQSSWGDGRIYTTNWTGSQSTFTPSFTSHLYVNKIAKSEASLFNFPKISPEDKKKFNLFDYPKIYDFYKQNSILGWNDPVTEAYLTNANASIGKYKQVRMFLLVFKNQPMQAGIAQQSFWKNGNKNEVNLCVGLNENNEVSWVYPFCWDNENLIISLRNEVGKQGKFNAKQASSDLITAVMAQFSRKQFKDFDYVQMDVPEWLIGVSVLFVILVNIGTVYWVVNNEYK